MRRLSLQARLILCFGGLTALSVGLILLLMYQFTRDRIATDVQSRLGRAAEVVQTYHITTRSQRIDRTRQKTTEPSVRALASAEVDRATLVQATQSLVEELGSPFLAMLAADGDVLAMAGEWTQPGGFTLSGNREPYVDYIRLGDRLVENVIVPIVLGDRVERYFVSGTLIDSAILDTYGVGVDCGIRLIQGEVILGGTTLPPPPSEYRRIRTVPLAKDFKFLVELDSRVIARPLWKIFQRIAWIGGISVCISIVGAWMIAGWISRPIDVLAETADSVRQGRLSERSEVSGAPVVRQLSQAFNSMVDDLVSTQEQLQEHAKTLERQMRDRKELEAALVHAQKMEGIGRLAGGVAHDFNNLLTIILSHCQLALEEENLQSELREGLEDIRDAGQHAATLTRQLLVFSRRHVEKATVLNINEVVSHAGSMLRRLISENIDLQTKLESQVCLVRIDPVEFEQVIVNLAVNARDAMPNGGELLIATRNVDLQTGAFPDLEELQSGPYALLEVTDTGTGMDETTRYQIFEPFFTTKSEEKGTGLGLSTVYGIVTKCNGAIWVESALGEGTKFSVYLPEAQEEDLPEEEDAAIEQAPAASGNETILIAEDEEAVARLVARVLTGKGYRVLITHSGEEAIEVFKENEDRIRLIVTDVIMPGISGPELSEILRRKYPRIPVIFMSGYPGEALGQHPELELGVNLLEKPIEMNVLLRTVADALKAA